MSYFTNVWMEYCVILPKELPVPTVNFVALLTWWMNILLVVAEYNNGVPKANAVSTYFSRCKIAFPKKIFDLFH